MSSEYSVQRFSQDSFPLMRELFASAFNVHITYEDFQKKYDTLKLGHAVIGFIAVHKPTNSPAAYYGVFPLKALINSKEILIAQSGDTMTHKDHQKKGLFISLANMTFEACRKEGIEIIFGLPNKNSYRGFTQKLGWIHLDDIDRYDLKLPIKTFPLPKLFKSVGLFRMFLMYVKFILGKRQINRPADFTNTEPYKGGKILRNEPYLKYKQGLDKVFIKLEGITFWIKFTDVLWIGEISDYNQMSRPILKKIKRIAFILGYNTISFHINKSSTHGFLQFFKKHDSEPSCFYYLNGSYSNFNLILTGADFDTW